MRTPSPTTAGELAAYAPTSPGTLRARAVCRPNADVAAGSYSETEGTLPVNGASLPTITCATDRHLVGIGTFSEAAPDKSYTAQMNFADDHPGRGPDSGRPGRDGHHPQLGPARRALADARDLPALGTVEQRRQPLGVGDGDGQLGV